MQDEFGDLNDESYLSVSVDFGDEGSADVGSNVRSNENDVSENEYADVGANEDDASPNVHDDVQTNEDGHANGNEVENVGANNDVEDETATTTLTISEPKSVRTTKQ